jgi:hypothetical protein
MKLKSLILILLLASSEAPAQETAPLNLFSDSPLTRSDLFLGFSYLRWNESLRVQQGANVSSDSANFAGFNMNLEKNFVYQQWGFGAGASLGTGKATAGGNNTLNFQKSNQAWSSFGVMARGYQRLTTRVHIGLAVPVIMRQIQWSSDTPGVTVTSGQNINLGVLFEINARIAKDLDFYQEIGPLVVDNTTFWRLGINYRLK